MVVVSASLDVYLSEWCKNHGVDLICTKLEVKEGLMTGRYYGGDCAGKEKARRICKTYDLKKYASIYAYGDTKDDEPMLTLASKRYYRWRDVSHADTAGLFATMCFNASGDLHPREIEIEDEMLDALVANQANGQSS